MSERAQRWLAPLGTDAPAGQDARYQPAHEQVREQVARLESPEGRAVDWARVLHDGNEVLTTHAKDLWIGCCVAHAAHELEGLGGMLDGVALLDGLLEHYWDSMYPPPQRVRARVAAVQWWLDRTAHRLAEPASPDAESLAQARAAFEALAARLRARFGDETPGTQPVLDALGRLGLAHGAQEPATPSAQEPAAPNAQEPATPSVLAPGAPPNATAANAAGPAAAPTETAAETATNAPEAPAVPTDPSAAPTSTNAPAPESEDPWSVALVARVGRWLEPIRPDAPCGDDGRYDDPVHEALRQQIARLESPAATAPNWDRFIADASELLERRSKDLLIAAYLGEGLRRRDGLAGAFTGAALMYALMERYWDGLFPGNERGGRARASAVSWYVDRLSTLSELKLGAADGPTLELFDTLLERLSALLAERFDDKQRPGLAPLRDQLARLRLNLPAPARAPAPEPAPSPPTPATSPSTTPAALGTTPAAAPSAAAPSEVPPGALVPPDNAANPVLVGKFLQATRAALFELSHKLRAQVPENAQPYRLARTAAYLRFYQKPPDEHGRTKVQLADTPDSFEALLAEGKHAELVDAAERALETSPLWLDLHRYSWLGLQAQGDAYAAAAGAVLQATAALATAYPGLLELTAADGRGFASPDTQKWLLEHGGAGGGRRLPNEDGGSAGAAPGPELDTALALLSKGQLEAAVAAFRDALRGLAEGRRRFVATLNMAEALAPRSRTLALGLYAGLADELEQRDLAAWDPELAARCLAGYHHCVAPLAKQSEEMARTASLIYRRLCSVDPSRALELSMPR